MTSTNDDDLFLVVVPHVVHGLKESFPLQEIIGKNYVSFPARHEREPVEEFRMYILMGSVREKYSLGSELHICLTVSHNPEFANFSQLLSC